MYYRFANEYGVYKTRLSATWFGSGGGFPKLEPNGYGAPPDNGFPGIEIKLDVDTEAHEDDIPPPAMGEMIAENGKEPMSTERFMALWDGILATLRPRPGAF